jgi:CRP-like cAMP-binding protein/CheY-like chemotaxis protein
MQPVILLIEDNTEVRENVAEILELADYQVRTAPNGREGVRLAKECLPDLVICDIMMPELDGYGVLHLLGKDPATAGIPFIFLTAKSEKNDYRKGMSLGADDYITKPFDDTELLNAVEIRLKKAAILKKEYARGTEGIDAFIQEVKGGDINILISDEREALDVKKKQLIYQEGKRPSYLYFLRKGKIKTFKINDDGKEFITELLNEGEFFGYVPLLEGGAYKESAEALEDAEIMRIPRADFEALLLSSRQVSNKFIRMLANNIAGKEEQLLALAYNSLRKRVADALLTLDEKYLQADGKSPIHINRENLANMVGTATESLIRTLSDFKHEKLIDIRDGAIMILAKDKLKNMVN